MARLIGAPDVGNVVPLLHPVGHRTLEKTFFAEVVLASLGVVLGRNHARDGRAFVAAAGGNHASAIIEEAAEAVPVALAWGAGDHVIHRGDDVLNRVYVTRMSGRRG